MLTYYFILKNIIKYLECNFKVLNLELSNQKQKLLTMSQQLTIKQLQKIEEIRNESYIKSVDHGFLSTGECSLLIVDTKNRVSSSTIDENGMYVPYLNGY